MSTDEQLKRAADLKEWLESRISELQEEVEKLKEVEGIVDGILRASSFRPASEVMAASPVSRTPPKVETEEDEGGQIPEIRELRRDKGGETIAVARITNERVVIEPVAEVTLKAETPPFKSFLIGKILTNMKAKDQELATKGSLPKGKELSYTVSEKGGRIAGITIENYRENERLTEILNTVGWTFSRMLEKSAAATSSR